MSCKGRVKAGIAVDKNLLGKFQADFLGVSATSSCRPKAGCLITVCRGTLVLRDSSVSWVASGPLDNLVCVLGSSHVELHNSRFMHNTVRPLACFDQSYLVLHNSSLSHNVVRQGLGGGLSAEGGATVVITDGSRVHNNTAGQFGGGVFASGKSSVTLTGGSSVTNNAVEIRSGGGVAVNDDASLTISGRSIVRNNTAKKIGGGVLGMDNANVLVTECSSVQDNTALSGGGLTAMNNAKVIVMGSSTVHSNIARSRTGGGVVATDNATVTVTGRSSVHSNVAGLGGGLMAVLNASLTLDDSSLHNNSAWEAGGGLIASNSANVIISNHSQVHSNRVLNGSGGGLFVTGRTALNISGNSRIVGNNCSKGMGGGIAVGLQGDDIKFGDKGLRILGPAAETGGADNEFSLALVQISNSTVANNTSFLSAGGGLAIGTSAIVALTNGTQVVGNRAVNSSGGGVLLIDRGSLKVDASVVFVDNAVNRGYVGATLAALDNSKVQLPLYGNLTKCSAGVYLGRTPCEEGETLVNDVCTCCQRHTYSSDNTSACALCPANGVCSGGSLVDPSPGHWQSSSRSIEMHRCPLFLTSCNHIVTKSGTVQTCNPGYVGNLCGACQLPEYGMMSPLRCGKCMRPAVQLGLYLLVCCATVTFIAYTVHATWQDNLQGGQSVRATDLIKVLVQFLQYVVIIGSVSIPWPAGFDLQRWFQLASSVFGASSGEALSLDCWLYHYIPQLPKGVLHLAIQRQLVYFLAPVGVLVGVVVLQCLTWTAKGYVFPSVCRCREGRGTRGRRVFMVVRKLPVTVLVLTYYAYPTLIKASLGFFACLRIDRAAAKPGLPAPLNHPLGYWVNDIQQACFTGYHLGWALGLGLPSMLLWCIIVPMAMGLGLKLAGTKVNSDSFREHFGFLYRNYKPERIWWEAVWAARTVVLTLVSVFAFPMDRYFSVMALLVVFWASAALQLVFKPYAMSTLHRMHIVSTSCLAATTLGALAMFAYDIQENTAETLRYVITSLVLLINVVFVGWCCMRLAPVAKQWCMNAMYIANSFVYRVGGGVLGCTSPPVPKQNRGKMPGPVPLGGSSSAVQSHAAPAE